MLYRIAIVKSLVLILLLSAAPAQADEILDEIAAARKAYEAGDYSEAVEGLEFAAQQIRQLQAGRIADALPAPLSGWEAEEVESTAMGGAFMGGGIAAGRAYTRGDAAVDVELIGEAPMLQAVLMMLKNPMMISGSGAQVKRIAGYKALIEFDGGDRSGNIKLVVADAVLVTIDGNNVGQEDLEAYAAAVDYALIEELASGK